MKFNFTSRTYYINKNDAFASKELSDILLQLIIDTSGKYTDLVFLCIGSDRVTGDSLGPMIGHQLSKSSLPNTYVYGTLDSPVHALNLPEISEYIHSAHPNALVIALDASLGSRKHLGYITVGKGSLFPGAGVHKQLPPIGDIFITGIVNVTGSFEHLILQTTRLSTIMKITDCICAGVLLACKKYFLYQDTLTEPYQAAFENDSLSSETELPPLEETILLCEANDLPDKSDSQLNMDNSRLRECASTKLSCDNLKSKHLLTCVWKEDCFAEKKRLHNNLLRKK